ncbi:MAG: hypothetical protein WED05_10535 [Candidatus Atabeyarchaeum deiterrae]
MTNSRPPALRVEDLYASPTLNAKNPKTAEKDKATKDQIMLSSVEDAKMSVPSVIAELRILTKLDTNIYAPIR